MFAPFTQNRYFCRLKFHSMRKTASIILFSALVLAALSGCSGYNKILKASDYNTKYSLAKTYYMEGRYTSCSSIRRSVWFTSAVLHRLRNQCICWLHATTRLRTICLHPSITWHATGRSQTVHILRTVSTGQARASSWIPRIRDLTRPAPQTQSCSCRDSWRHIPRVSTVLMLSR